MSQSLQEERQQTFREIDQTLDELVDVTADNKVKAQQVGNELEAQTEMAKDINNNMDTANTKVVAATDKLVEVEKATASNWISWILIVILVILCVIFLIV